MCFYDYVYRDGSTMPPLTAYAESGPWKGIYMTPERAKTFDEMELIAKKFDRPRSHVVMLYDSPGLYLFSRNRPAVNSVWQITSYGQQDLIDYWRTHMDRNGYAVFERRTGRGPLDSEIGPPSRKVFETPHFVVYSQRD
jgi:hypothetical protein